MGKKNRFVCNFQSSVFLEPFWAHSKMVRKVKTGPFISCPHTYRLQTSSNPPRSCVCIDTSSLPSGTWLASTVCVKIISYEIGENYGWWQKNPLCMCVCACTRACACVHICVMHVLYMGKYFHTCRRVWWPEVFWEFHSRPQNLSLFLTTWTNWLPRKFLGSCCLSPKSWVSALPYLASHVVAKGSNSSPRACIASPWATGPSPLLLGFWENTFFSSKKHLLRRKVGLCVRWGVQFLKKTKPEVTRLGFQESYLRRIKKTSK